MLQCVWLTVLQWGSVESRTLKLKLLSGIQLLLIVLFTNTNSPPWKTFNKSFLLLWIFCASTPLNICKTSWHVTFQHYTEFFVWSPPHKLSFVSFCKSWQVQKGGGWTTVVYCDATVYLLKGHWPVGWKVGLQKMNKKREKRILLNFLLC